MVVDFTKQDGLVPAIVQDFETNEVLMLAYMDEEALELTKTSGYAHYFSRSKQRIWKKGESSGHTQEIKQILLDCDEDTILLKVKQIGKACHTGSKSCFFNDIKTNEKVLEQEEISSYSISDKLYHIVLERAKEANENSYVASLFKKGENSILKKIVEEAGEFCFAIKDDDTDEIIYEAADLLFHCIVALGYKKIDPDRVKQELQKRFGMSGIEEKNSRK